MVDDIGRYRKSANLTATGFRDSAIGAAYITTGGFGARPAPKHRKLRSLGFDGALTIEREISGPQQIEDIKRAMAILKPLIA